MGKEAQQDSRCQDWKAVEVEVEVISDEMTESLSVIGHILDCLLYIYKIGIYHPGQQYTMEKWNWHGNGRSCQAKGFVLCQWKADT